jgi:hypothetical protein
MRWRYARFVQLRSARTHIRERRASSSRVLPSEYALHCASLMVSFGLLLRWTAAIAAAAAAGLLAAACDGKLKENGGDEPDAGALAQIPTPPCDPPAAAPGDGHHNPGEDCLMCHYQGGGGPPFTFAGTLYAASGGGAPLAAATLHLIDALGTDVVVTTQANGNFWSFDLVTFPVVAFASLCPDVKPMVTPLGDADGSCNRAGCHTSGFRLHVP